jgi:anti-sigma factor RsiW
MTCSECLERLSALIDRELSEEEVRTVSDHLDGCPACCREFALLFCADAEMKQVPVPPAPDRLWPRLENALPPASAPAQRIPLADVLTFEEAAHFLRLSAEELRNSLNALPHFVIAGQVRFRKASLDAWIEGQEQAAAPMIESGVSQATGTTGTVVDFMAARARMNRRGRI